MPHHTVGSGDRGEVEHDESPTPLQPLQKTHARETMDVTRKDRLWVAGLKALVGAIIANSAVRWAAVATLDISTEFPPMAGPGPTIIFTTVGVLGATGVFAVIRRRAARPEHLFRWIALGVLLLLFGPDLWLLSDGSAGAFPGATPTSVGVLMLMHVVAAAVIVWFLTVRGQMRPTETNP